MIKPIAFFASVLLLTVGAISNVGCNMDSSAPQNAASDVTRSDGTNSSKRVDEANSDVQTGAKASNCSLEYYPVSDARKADYDVTGVGAEPYSLVQSAVTDSGFVETRNFSSGLEIKNNWVCEPDGIRNVEFTNTGLMKDGNFTIETVKSSGVTLPREISVGKEFQSSYDVKANVNISGMKADGVGKIAASSKVVSMDEPVKVGDREYKAVRIDTVAKINLTVSGRGIEAATVNTSNWYAPGVGLVKQDTKSKLGSQVITLKQ